ncbi:hypothetical protein [Phascolarctobacterium succinatutens]|uniref:hypothetical protein n=1 Tax=Phascolarctobacterium succinatutens TaxID=626940 RepID=UPI0026E9F4A6|nr:hypothetical protein [Phascolarctobacterium succinatutens]MBS5425535.1 hypothetical protein [Phascolarctobacterium succinatutens]
MKKIICFIVTVFIATLIVGCGSSNDTIKSNPFAKYAERPVTSEFYQRYFVNEYCKDANNFTKEYQEFLEKVGTRQFKMQIVRPENSLFYKKVTWNIADRDDSNPDAPKYRYLGETKDGKPHGVGMLYRTLEGETVLCKVYGGNFKDGRYDGYGFLYADYGIFYSKIKNSVYAYIMDRAPSRVMEVLGDSNQQATEKKKKHVEANTAIGKVNIPEVPHLFSYQKRSEFVPSGRLNALRLMINNSIAYEGNFKNGLPNGKGNLYYSFIARGTDPKAIEAWYLKQDIAECERWLKNAKEPFVYDIDKEYMAEKSKLEAKLKALGDTPLETQLANGRWLVMSGEFDDGVPDGDFVCYTQDQTAGEGYKIMELELDDGIAEGKAKVWNIKGDNIYKGDIKEAMSAFYEYFMSTVSGFQDKKYIYSEDYLKLSGDGSSENVKAETFKKQNNSDTNGAVSNNNKAINSSNSSANEPKYNLYHPQGFLNGDKHIPEVYQNQGVHRYVDCRSAKIMSRNNGQTIVQYDMIIVGGNGQQDRKQNIVGLLTGKGVAVQYRADDGSWRPMNMSGASAAWYNAGLVLVDYLKL